MSLLVIILRVILLVAPLVGLILWIKWRADKKRSDADLEKEFKKLRLRLMVVVLSVIVAIVGIKMTDQNVAKAGAEYSPPVFKDGKIIPGGFKDSDDKKCDPNKDKDCG